MQPRIGCVSKQELLDTGYTKIAVSYINIVIMGKGVS